MRKIRLDFTPYKGFAIGLVWVNNHFERGVCFILPFFSVDLMKKLN